MLNRIIFFLFISVLLIHAQTSEKYQTIEDLIKSTNFEKAQLTIENNLKNSPKDANLYYYLGIVHLAKMNADDAIEQFEKAIDLKDDDYRFYENLGDAYGLKAQTSNMFSAMFVIGDMRESWEKAIELKPDLVSSRVRLATYYFMAPSVAGGDDEKALKLADEVIELEPAKGYALKGRYYQQKEEFDKAEQQFLSSLKIDSTNGNILNLLGYLYLKQKKYDDALKSFNRYVTLYPNEANPYDSRADYFLAVAKYDSALVMYEKALALNPEFHSSIIGKAKTLVQLNRQQEAQMIAKSYLKKYPDGRFAREATKIAEE